MPSSLASKFNEFSRGFTTPLRALSLILAHPKLILLSILPMAITLLVLSGTIYALLTGAWHTSNSFFESWVASYSGALSHVMVVLAGALLLYITFHTFTLFISLFSSPFNDFLAEETEKASGVHSTRPSLLTLVHVFFLDLRKTALSLIFVACFGLFSFVPVIGFFSLFGFALVNTFTFVTYPQSRRKHGILESLSWMRQNWASSLGFGLVTLLLFGIPILNLFALPLSVVGGTMIFIKK